MRGFSLVELSIVLVILGLLTGGILSGQSLIRAAELRAISNEAARHYTSFQTFRDKYAALPGDFKDATRFWLTDNVAATCTTNSGAAGSATGACDGNGNGVIDCGVNVINVGTEGFQLWKHLALAGLIEGTYTGRTAFADCNNATIDTNVPRSKLANGGWGFAANTMTVINSPTRNFTLPGGFPANVLVFGAANFGAPPSAGILTPEEAWNIDTKIDDGRPAYGSIIARSHSVFGANTCTTAANTNDLAAEYALTIKAKECALIFTKMF